MLYYQIDKFREAGIAEPPKTFDDLLAAAAKVNKPDLPAIAMRGSPADASGNIWIFNLFFYGSGAKYFADFPKDMTPTVNSPEAVKALETWVALKQKYSAAGAVNFVFDDIVTAMQQGKVGMVIEGAPLAGRILDPKQSKVSGNLGFAVVPGGQAGPKPSFTSHGLCVSAGSDHKEAAYLFIEWIMAKQQMLKIATSSNYLATTRNSVWENPDFIKKYNFDFGGGRFLKAYQDSLAAAPADYYPPFAGWQLVGQRIAKAVQEAEIGTKSPAQALDDANKDIKATLIDAGYLKN
jgi:ABC-type glycerol-3-phosphate transport system substrate-binding protein